jgi:hypothetical protein
MDFVYEGRKYNVYRFVCNVKIHGADFAIQDLTGYWGI